MHNVARGVGLSGLTSLILACAMTAPAAAVEVQVPAVRIQAPKITAPPRLNKTVTLRNGSIVRKGTGWKATNPNGSSTRSLTRDIGVSEPAEPTLTNTSRIPGVRALNPQPLPP